MSETKPAPLADIRLFEIRELHRWTSAFIRSGEVSLAAAYNEADMHRGLLLQQIDWQQQVIEARALELVQIEEARDAALDTQKQLEDRIVDLTKQVEALQAAAEPDEPPPALPARCGACYLDYPPGPAHICDKALEACAI